MKKVSDNAPIYFSEVYEVVSTDDRLRVLHVSLYAGLYYNWVKNGFVNPVPITRKMMMKLSKIKSTATYHQCLQDLSRFGYITYRPSYHPKKGSEVFVNPLVQIGTDRKLVENFF